MRPSLTPDLISSRSSLAPSASRAPEETVLLCRSRPTASKRPAQFSRAPAARLSDGVSPPTLST
eukprot:4897971-Pyramimonas_sp.AAC.1